MNRGRITGPLSPIAEIPRAVLSIVWAVVGVNFALQDRYTNVFPTIDGICQLLGARDRENIYRQVSRGVSDGWLTRENNRVGISKKTTRLLAASLSQCEVVQSFKAEKLHERRIVD